MNRTKIGWARNPDGSPGYTWNPISGCLNHDNGLCKGGGFPCYAYKLANRRLKPLYLANKNGLPYSIFEKALVEELKAEADPFYPRFWEERMSCQFSTPPAYSGRFSQQVRLALRQKHRKGIFVCDMSDLFGIGIPENWTWQVMQLIKAYPQHRFYLLTKQPAQLSKFSPFPDNCYVGVTACNEDMWTKALWELSKVQAPVKYISIEPFLERIPQYVGGIKNCGINWLIIGACTGTLSELMDLRYRLPNWVHMEQLKRYGNKWTLQPKIEWVREIVEAADKAGVKVFLKDNLAPLIKWPQDGPWAFKNLSNMLRQEMPEIK